MPHEYTIRVATVGDLEAIVHHRIAMFTDMGTTFDVEATRIAFAAWAREALPSGVYRAWVAEHRNDVVAGAGAVVVPWPPGPRNRCGRMAFVYNVYTEPAHRGRGLARRLMTAVHDACAAEGVTSVGLAASPLGRPLYDSMGYHEATNPYMFLTLDRQP